MENTPVCYHLLENLNPNPHHIDRSSLLTFATALNLCYQRSLFQLHKHCQSIVIIRKNQIILQYILIFFQDTSNKSGQSTNEILPIQIFESYTENISSYFPVNKLQIILFIHLNHYFLA